MNSESGSRPVADVNQMISPQAVTSYLQQVSLRRENQWLRMPQDLASLFDSLALVLRLFAAALAVDSSQVERQPAMANGPGVRLSIDSLSSTFALASAQAVMPCGMLSSRVNPSASC